jgi:hypothetical protein
VVVPLWVEPGAPKPVVLFGTTIDQVIETLGVLLDRVTGIVPPPEHIVWFCSLKITVGEGCTVMLMVWEASGHGDAPVVVAVIVVWPLKLGVGTKFVENAVELGVNVPLGEVHETPLWKPVAEAETGIVVP